MITRHTNQSYACEMNNKKDHSERFSYLSELNDDEQLVRMNSKPFIPRNERML